MFRSIQWTLQLWHAGLLAVVLIGFGVASFFGISRARFQDLDAELERAVQLLAAGFRPPTLPEAVAGGPSTDTPAEPRPADAQTPPHDRQGRRPDCRRLPSQSVARTAGTGFRSPCRPGSTVRGRAAGNRITT
jgi:hypothetical protein